MAKPDIPPQAMAPGRWGPGSGPQLCWQQSQTINRSCGLALMFALIEGLSFGEIATRVLHEVGLGLLAAKAVGLPLNVEAIEQSVCTF